MTRKLIVAETVQAVMMINGDHTPLSRALLASILNDCWAAGYERVEVRSGMDSPPPPVLESAEEAVLFSSYTSVHAFPAYPAGRGTYMAGHPWSDIPLWAILDDHHLRGTGNGLYRGANQMQPSTRTWPYVELPVGTFLRKKEEP